MRDLSFGGYRVKVDFRTSNRAKFLEIAHFCHFRKNGRVDRDEAQALGWFGFDRRQGQQPSFSMTPVARHSSASAAKGFVSIDRVRPGKEMLARVVAMLTRLIDRFDTNSRTS